MKEYNPKQPTVWVPYHILKEAWLELQAAHQHQRNPWGKDRKIVMQGEGGLLGVYDAEQKDPRQGELDV